MGWSYIWRCIISFNKSMKKGSFSITLYRKNSSKTGEAIIMRYKTFEAFQNNEGLPDNYTGGVQATIRDTRCLATLSTWMWLLIFFHLFLKNDLISASTKIHRLEPKKGHFELGNAYRKDHSCVFMDRYAL